MALVFVGGALGTALRAVSLAMFPTDADWPVAVFVVNVLGSLLLGALVAVLTPAANRAPASDTPSRADRRRTDARLLLGTGVLGGFTTYSALAADAVSLASGGHAVVGLLYAAGSVVVGVLAAAVGMVLGGVATGARR